MRSQVTLLCAVAGTAALLWACPATPAAEAAFEGKPLIQSLQPMLAEPQGASQPRERIRICSYNIQDFSDGRDDGEQRTPERASEQARLAAELVNEVSPDIAVLQEIENGEALQILNRHLAAPYPFGYITDFGDRAQNKPKLNIAVLSRYPLEQVREIDFGPLEGAARPPRGLLSFVLDLGEDRHLLVYGVHLKSNWGKRSYNVPKRRNALSILRADMGNVLAAHPEVAWEVLVVGDMNVDPEAASFAGDKSLEPLAGMVDLWRGRSLEERITVPTRSGYPAVEFPPVTFDRLVASPELTEAPWLVSAPHVLQRGVDPNVFILPGDNDGHVSDHYPVYVDLLRGLPGPGAMR